MKQLILLLYLLVVCALYPQTKQTAYKALSENLMKDIIKKCEGNDGPAHFEETFSKIYSEIFSTVVLSSADIINNGSAFAYSQDLTKNTFSLNGTTRLWKADNPWLLDMGISLKNKDNTFNYYQNNTWSSDITIKAGIVFPLGPRLRYIKRNCQEVNEKRQIYFERKMDSITNDLLNLDLAAMEARLKELEKVKANPRNRTGYADIDAKLDLGISVEKIIAIEEAKKKSQESLIALNSTKVEELRLQYLSEFDKKDIVKNSYTGHKALWVNGFITYTNSSIKIDNPTLFDEEIEDKYRSISKGSIDISFNMQYVTATKRQYFFHLNTGSRLNRYSYLDNANFAGKKFNVALNASGTAYNVTATDVAEPIGTYHDLHDAVLASDVYVNAAFIPNSSRNWLGILVRGAVSVPVQGNEHYYAKNFTALAGPIIRTTRAKSKTFAAATFTILGGFEATSVETRAGDFFVIKASAALPFNVFERK